MADASGKDVKLSSSGLEFQLHPLVLINISDHFVRIRANGLGQADGRVYGCLLGQQTGRVVDISNSFELQVTDSMDGPSIDEAFLTRKTEQYKQTFAALDIVGWYTTASQIGASDMLLHRKIMNLNESPVFLLLDPAVHDRHKDLPVSLYESELHTVAGTQQYTFVQAKYAIQTSEAERIGVNQVAKVLPTGNDSGTEQLSAHFAALQSAIKMLNGRVGKLHDILTQMAEGKVPLNHQLLRQASCLLRGLPTMSTPAFGQEYLTEYNDALLIIFLSSMTKGSNGLNELVDKFNIAYDRSGSKRRGLP